MGRMREGDAVGRSERAFRAALACAAGLTLAACAEEPARAPSHDEPVACKTDGDCRAPPCGPCTAGTPITDESLSQTCVVNPCPQAAAHCTPAGTCAVKCAACAAAPR